jgi:hypothetical protein
MHFYSWSKMRSEMAVSIGTRLKMVRWLEILYRGVMFYCIIIIIIIILLPSTHSAYRYYTLKVWKMFQPFGHDRKLLHATFTPPYIFQCLPVGVFCTVSYFHINIMSFNSSYLYSLNRNERLYKILLALCKSHSSTKGVLWFLTAYTRMHRD